MMPVLEYITIHVPSLATSTVMHIHMLDAYSLVSVVSLAYVSVPE